MTEKRFTHKKWLDDRQLFDGEEPFAIVDVYIQANYICDKLNELAEENQRLKNDCSILVQSNQDYRAENEQLKKENYELHKRLGDFEQFEEHIKERTSKTSVNDIIGLVKTDEPTNSVELKKELYK